MFISSSLSVYAVCVCSILLLTSMLFSSVDVGSLIRKFAQSHVDNIDMHSILH